MDRLLADEQHAVRYARHWLDVLRYADTDEQLSPASGIHLWRDWIIRALHEDMPFDQFVQVQLTGRRSRERSQMSARNASCSAGLGARPVRSRWTRRSRASREAGG
ncbi:MAG: DUF1549 domain-containing protein [Verrucomicrobiota bacterium]